MFGYCVAPLNIAALVSVFVPLIYVRLPVTFAAWAWCIWGAFHFRPGLEFAGTEIAPSFGELSGWNQARKATHYARSVPPAVSHVCRLECRSSLKVCIDPRAAYSTLFSRG